MRWWGATVVVVCAAGVVLPDPLGKLLAVAVVGAAIIAIVVERADNKPTPAQAEDTARTLAQFEELRRMKAEEDADWAALMGVVEQPLGPGPSSPARLRKVSGRVPRQRQAGELS